MGTRGVLARGTDAVLVHRAFQAATVVGRTARRVGGRAW